MVASAIAISSDSSNESAGSPLSRVILFGYIPTVIPSSSVITLETSAIAFINSSATPVVETTIIASPIRLCGFVWLSSLLDLDSDSPDEMASLEYITLLPATSSFLFTNSFEDSDPSEASNSSEAPPSHDPYVTTIAHWRSRAIPLGRLYCTRPNGPRRVMTVRKRVGPLFAHRLAWRRVSPRSLDHHLSSSSSPMDFLPVHSLGLDAPGQAHFGASTQVVSPRLGYPPVRSPRHSEAFRRWCTAPLSTFYPLTTSESSSRDSLERLLHLSFHSAGPSCKRCRELDIVDRDDVKVNPRDDREEFKDSARDIIVLGIDPRSVEDMPVDLDDAIHNFYHHMSEVRVDRIVGIKATQSQLEADQMIASEREL
nr:hypothetical protein [Tanacetum cinerariifolium]